jgi:catechol 2,3-dioxygenase-like lactoylglutathione lyase family enzyme
VATIDHVTIGGRLSDGGGFHEWNDFSIMTSAGHRDDGAPGPRPEYGPTYYGAFIRDGIRVAELAAAKRFYTAVADATGSRTREREDRLQLITESGTFSLLEGRPTQNLHLAIGVGDEETLRAFHQSGLAAGGRDNGAPGERPEYHPGYYGAYLLDPDGNNIESVWHKR